MESYAIVLFYAIAYFALLMLLEFAYSLMAGKKLLRGMDSISSLSSGITNIIKDVLGLGVIILGYDFLFRRFAFNDLGNAWYVYLLAFIGKDFAGYWIHRWEHKINVFWNRHVIHHSSEEFNLPCALRQSVSEIFGFFGFLFLPMVLIGVPPEVVAVVAPIHLFAQFWYHTRAIGKMGWLEYILVTPSHHRVHHAMNEEYLDKNLSQIFIIWDKLFGTFQEELDEAPPVFGVKRPMETWNPFLINFKHFWTIARDAWFTRDWKDKARIWFKPTGWRPEDVKQRFPLKEIDDVYTYQKYDTPTSGLLLSWSWFQLSVALALTLYMFSILSNYMAEGEGALVLGLLPYGIFIFLSIFSYTTLMDRVAHSWWLELLKSAVGFTLIWQNGGWYGLETVVPYATIIFGVYLAISPLVVAAFVFGEFRSEKANSSLSTG